MLGLIVSSSSKAQSLPFRNVILYDTNLLPTSTVILTALTTTLESSTIMLKTLLLILGINLHSLGIELNAQFLCLRIASLRAFALYYIAR